MPRALKGGLRLTDYMLLGVSVFAFLSLAGAWAFGLRIFPQNRVTGWTGGYQEPSYGLSNQGICVFLAIAVVLVTRAQTRIPRWFGRTHSSSIHWHERGVAWPKI